MIRAKSEPSGSLFANVHLNVRHRSPERAISNANSEFLPTQDATVLHAKGQSEDLLGLHVVCDNPDPCGDMIFVHGLGGTAKKTWCWNRDISYVWPSWLAEEDGLSSYKISTFGYNSNFKGTGTNLNIIAFAKDLLFQMLTFSNGVERNLSN